MSSTPGRTAFSREIVWLVVLFVISVTNFALYSVAEKHIDRANEARQQSFVLADELRQSSDDLTRMVRTYVITGNPIYKQYYQEILDIRNGVRARPVRYESIYWDLVLADDVRPRPDSGQKIALLEMMGLAGFDAAEFDKLKLAKANSDALTAMEFEAMRLSEVTGKDAELMRERAELMLNAGPYHQAKAGIMRPIAEFYELLDKRTLSAVRSAEDMALYLRLVMVVLIVALMFSMWRTYRALHLTLGGSVDEVRSKIDRIASGDFTSTTADDVRHRNTVSGWLSEMLYKLRDSAQQQKILTERLAAEKERAQVTLSCIGDAVITTDAQGRITFLNEVAIGLTAWSQADALGKPLHEIFNIINETTRQSVDNPVEQVLRDGKTVLLANHTLLVARDGTEYNVEDSAAPIYLESGELLGCVLVFHDVTEKHKLLRDVRWQAGHDVLTGLPNRALLADRFQRALASTHRQKDSLAVCLLDLDEFKPVNDTHGHDVGDRLLVKAAQRLGDEVRAEDTVARMGGDEFVLLLGGVRNQAEAEATLQRVMKAMETPYVIDDKTLRVSASIGVALFPYDDADPDTLLRHADQAMYQAKQAGRNRYHFFDVERDKENQTTHQSSSRIKQAMLDDELRLYYQPKVNMRSGEIVGMEALLRWQHPQRGLMAPGAFLPMLEQNDLIADIGEWVIAAALQQIARWQQMGKVWPVSVNIAARHFQKPDFLDSLKAILARHADVPARLLQIEILESSAQRDIDQVSEHIVQCQALGVTFALDDFGTGYSSLSYLKHLPTDIIKIDQSFVHDMLDDPEALALVEAIIGLTNVFGRGVIAEGVESSEHGVLLMRLGCDVAQGHAIAEPMLAEQVMDWSRRYVPDEKWRMWAAVPWSLDDLPLLVAARDHLEWVNRIAAAVDDAALHFGAKQLINHHHCRFGHWYYGEGNTRYGHLPEFGEMQEVHVQVHRIGTEIVRLRDAGDLAKARSLLPVLFALKDQILAELAILQRRVSQFK